MAEQGMTPDEIMARLMVGCDRAERGEIPTFSERFAMREGARLLRSLAAENAKLREIAEVVAGRSVEDYDRCLLYIVGCEPIWNAAANQWDHAADCPVTLAQKLTADPQG